ncbi:MAG: protein kinase [Planctomycetaceae bacterium]
MSSADSSAHAVLLDNIADEFAKRQRAGEDPDVEEYVQRHPKLEAEIRQILGTLCRIEIARPETFGAGDCKPLSGADGAELTQLGDYRILREIGRGGMGVVFEAEQVSLGRRVALKALPNASQLDPRQFARFQLEARATARLEHPNIVPVHGVGEDNNLHYFTMQFIDGPGLGEVLNEVRLLRDQHVPSADSDISVVARTLCSGELSSSEAAVQDKPNAAHDGPAGETRGTRLPDGRRADSTVNLAASDTLVNLSGTSAGLLGAKYFHNVARIGIQIANALEFAHGHGILHRDVKPSNILLDLRGKAWITDFGLAKAEDAADVTHSGDIVGTLRYMAPERFEGWADRRSDVYSLGLTLYELATLQPAFGTGDRAQLIQNIRDAAPPMPRTIDARIPPDLETIILTAIHAEPAQRYRTAGLLAEDLERFLAGQPIRARRTSPLEKARLWTRRNPVVASLLATLILVLATGFATSTWYWHQAAVRAAALEVSERTATQYSRIATRNSADAEDARTAAVQQRDVALSKARDLRAAVDQLFTAIADDPALKTVALEKFRRGMLERANDYYDQFHAETPDDPALGFEHAQLTYKLAQMNRELGDLRTAKRLFSGVIDDADRSGETNPAMFALAYKCRLMVAECSWKLGEHDDQLSRLIQTSDRFVERHSPETAAKFLTECAHMAMNVRRVSVAWNLSNRAEELWSTIEPVPAMQRQHDLRVALHLTTRSRLALEIDEFNEARSAAGRAADLLKPYGPSDLVSATIADMDYLTAIAWSREGRYVESTEYLRKAIGIVSEMQQAHPDVQSHRTKLMDLNYHLALDLHRQSAHDDALALLTIVLRDLEEAEDQFEDVPVTQKLLRGDVLNLLGGVHSALGHFSEQGRFTQAAIETLEPLRGDDSNLQILVSLGNAWIHQADFLGNTDAEFDDRLAAFENATGILESVLTAEPADSQARQHLARAYMAQGLMFVDADQRQAAAEQFDKAIDLNAGTASDQARTHRAQMLTDRE